MSNDHLMLSYDNGDLERVQRWRSCSFQLNTSSPSALTGFPIQFFYTTCDSQTVHNRELYIIVVDALSLGMRLNY